MSRLAATFLLMLCFTASLASRCEAQNNPILGLWETADKDAVVEVYSCEHDSFCARFYWLKNDSAETPSLDDRNPDATLRKRPLCGLTFIGGIKEAEEGLYEGGWLYSPRHGSMFSANLRLIDPSTLELRGFVLISFLGGSQTWTRAPEAKPCAAQPQ